MAGWLSSIRQAPVSLVATATLSLDTNGRGLVEITQEAQRFVTGAGAAEGTLLLYIRHTSFQVPLPFRRSAGRSVSGSICFARVWTR